MVNKQNKIKKNGYCSLFINDKPFNELKEMIATVSSMASSSSATSMPIHSHSQQQPPKTANNTMDTLTNIYNSNRNLLPSVATPQQPQHGINNSSNLIVS
jgi:hypothetical protein